MPESARRPWVVHDFDALVAVSLGTEQHDLSNAACRCRPKLIQPDAENEFTRPLLLHNALAFVGVRVPDAWPSPGRIGGGGPA